MIKVYINNEEVLCDKNIVIKKEMLNTSSTILNNVYPKSWETTHDYISNYYYPLDYSNCKITDIRETPAEEGQTIEGTNFNINVDLSKEYSFDSFKGNTTQGVPSGYTQVDYIQSNNITHNTNYIDLGFKPNNNTSLELEFELFVSQTDYSRIYGSSNLFRTETSVNNVRVSFYWGNSARFPKESVALNTRYTAKQDKNLLYWNGELIRTTTDETWQDTNNLRLFSAVTGDRDSKVKIYYAKLWDNGTLIRHMIPAIRNRDNAIGMFDIVNNVFYENQGTTPFTYGNVVTPSPDTPIPIQTTTGEQKIEVANGTETQTYSINLGNIELCKIGDYQDRIYKDSGKWYLHKEIGKIILDGSEGTWNSWYNTENNNIGFYNYLNHVIAKGNNEESINGKAYCNKFNEATNRFDISDGVEEKFKICGGLGNSYLAISLSKDKLSDWSSKANAINSWKSWLASNNPIVYYILATPTTTEITDTELINQLESIELIEGTNNISASGNLPIIMNLHYNYVTHRIDTILLFSGIVKNTGNISLNPREPHYTSIEVLGYECFLSEGETLDFVIYEKTIEEAIDLVINTISDYGIIKGNINIKNPNDIIGAYSTKDKTAYDVFNYIADITQSRWTTRIIDENTIAIDFYDPDLMTNGIDLDFTQEFFANNNIIDMQYNYGTRDYRNKQVMNSNAVYSNIETNETIIADGYQTQFNTTDKIGNITKITLNGSEVIVKTKDEYELGYTCDFYYTPGNNYFESVDLVSTGAVLVIDYYAIIQGREILLNNTEINRVSSMTGRKGVISRYEDRNDATSTTELSQIGQSYLRYKGAPEIILTIESLNDIWNIGEKVEFNNAPLNELATEYMVKKKTIHYIPTVDNIFYEFELTSNFNSENAINYFDNQRSKNKGNIGQGETVSRNIDISNTANVIFYDVDIQEVSIEDDNILNSTLNSPLVQ